MVGTRHPPPATPFRAGESCESPVFSALRNSNFDDFFTGKALRRKYEKVDQFCCNLDALWLISLVVHRFRNLYTANLELSINGEEHTKKASQRKPKRHKREALLSQATRLHHTNTIKSAIGS
jgi:hypothetical protein